MQRRWDLYHLGSNQGRPVEVVKVVEEEEDVGAVKVEVEEGRRTR